MKRAWPCGAWRRKPRSREAMTVRRRRDEGLPKSVGTGNSCAQPGLAGLMDGSVSTLAPVFAAALATRSSWNAFLVGMAASVGAGISMGFAEALSDDGSLTGRGHPWIRGVVCGAMTTLGGVGHTLPFLIPTFRAAFALAFVVVIVELGTITWIRHRYMDTPVVAAGIQVLVGGALVFLTGVLIGSS